LALSNTFFGRTRWDWGRDLADLNTILGVGFDRGRDCSLAKFTGNITSNGRFTGSSQHIPS